VLSTSENADLVAVGGTNTLAVSSLTDCAAGTVFTGTSLGAVDGDRDQLAGGAVGGDPVKLSVIDWRRPAVWIARLRVVGAVAPVAVGGQREVP